MAIARGWEQACGRAEDFMAGRVPMGNRYWSSGERERDLAEAYRILVETKRRRNLDVALCRAIGRMR